MIYWFIGQPSHGKTTLAKEFKKELDQIGEISIHIDGDDLRRIFGNSYNKENFTKEYRIEQTERLQRFVSHIADQRITVIVSTVNPYREVRDKFRYSREDVVEIFVHRSGKTEREHYNVVDFELPIFESGNEVYSIDTTDSTVEESMEILKNTLTACNRF